MVGRSLQYRYTAPAACKDPSVWSPPMPAALLASPYAPTASVLASLLNATPTPTLTLTTCNPKYSAKERLIVSQNGPKGGYVLASSPSQITVGQVVRALEGPINIVSCLEDADCPQMERCNLRRPVHKIQAAISQVLDTMSLAELSNQGAPEVLTIK